MNHEELCIFFCPKASSTERLAKILAQRVLVQDVIVLQGEVGAGKTTFASALIKAMMPTPCIVGSPAFPLIKEHRIARGRLLHCDFYRLREQEKISELAFSEILDHEVVLIEWAERLPPSFLKKNYLTIQFEQRSSGRLLHVHGDLSWSNRITTIAYSSF
jgi:tRNA threonylcarbamoyl adenosine modification protein YjeE